MTNTGGSKPNSKVHRMIESYGLSGMGQRLEDAWLGSAGEQKSLRELASEFNQAVLEAALEKEGQETATYDIESIYETLTDEDVPREDGIRTERQLEREGISVDTLRGDFVSHQSIHTYLTEYIGIRRESQPTSKEDRIDAIERLKGRLTAVAESTLDSLISSDKVSRREYTLIVEVSAVCEECGTDYSLVNLISRGGCDCAKDDKYE